LISGSAALATLPAGLREPLIAEYQTIVQNFMEHRWLPSELSGGRFSEIVYTILDGQAKNQYASAPHKPSNFQAACQSLEQNKLPHVPRSFQILIPRLLPALYEVRNNRSVGHVGGDVNPNQMDSMLVLSTCNWIMGELIRFYHGLSTNEAQQVVDALVEIRIPVVWSDGTKKRILQLSLKLPDQISLLVATCVPDVTASDVLLWTEAPNKARFMRVVRDLHKKRYVDFDKSTDKIKILPPGSAYVKALIQKQHLRLTF
jgi:hypothetical protein